MKTEFYRFGDWLDFTFAFSESDRGEVDGSSFELMGAVGLVLEVFGG